MSDVSFELDGVGEQVKELRDERDNWTSSNDTWYVGTAVEYAVFVEYGTSEMDPRPFFRPALNEARSDLSAFIRDNTKKSIQQIDGEAELVRIIAFALERRVKEIITEKGLIDTGTMRASVAAVPSNAGELPDADDVDPSASATAEV